MTPCKMIMSLIVNVITEKQNTPRYLNLSYNKTKVKRLLNILQNKSITTQTGNILFTVY